MTTADVRRGIEMAGDQLTTQKLPDAVYWTGSLTRNRHSALTRDRDSDRERRPSIVRANLLPAFDEYNVAYKKRELPTLGPTVVVNGRTIGTWTAEVDQKSVLIRVTSSQELSQSQKRLLEKAAESYGSYIGSPARVAYGL